MSDKFKGRQSKNVIDLRGKSGWAMFPTDLMGGLNQMATAFQKGPPSESIQEISANFTKSKNPAGTAMADNSTFHAELRKGF